MFIDEGVVQSINGTHIFDLRKLSLDLADFKLDSDFRTHCNLTGIKDIDPVSDRSVCRVIVFIAIGA